MLSNLLVYRFLISNAFGLAGAAALALGGYVLPIFANDASHITYGIVALFLIGWFGVAKEILVASGGLNENKRSGGAQPALTAQRDKDMAKVRWLSAVAGWLVGLGLVGTVVGFYIALGGVDQSNVGQASGAQSAVAALMAGMKTALSTTILGAVLGMWHELNVQLLHTALAIYWSDRLAAADGFGERP